VTIARDAREILKKKIRSWAWYATLAILATWEAEIGRIAEVQQK
jgi:hypothetical protein